MQFEKFGKDLLTQPVVTETVVDAPKSLIELQWTVTDVDGFAPLLVRNEDDIYFVCRAHKIETDPFTEESIAHCGFSFTPSANVIVCFTHQYKQVLKRELVAARETRKITFSYAKGATLPELYGVCGELFLYAEPVIQFSKFIGTGTDLPNQQKAKKPKNKKNVVVITAQDI